MLKRSQTIKVFLSTAVVACATVFVGFSYASARDNTMPVGHVELKSFSSKEHARGVYLQSESHSGTSVHFTIPEGENSVTYVTEQFTPDFLFNALAVQWEGSVADQEHDTEFELFVRNNGGAVQRRILSPLSDDVKGPLPENTFVSNPVIVEDVESFWVTVTLHRNANDGSAPVVDAIDFTYIDSTRPTASDPQPVASIAVAHAAESVADQLGIVSREEWGADESLREDEDGNEIWPREYEEPQVFIVHHTAGTDGGDDPAATVRAIYYYHAVVLGWGDIGYNYVIDSNGVIYHGRKGGDGVVGGHTYNTVDDVGFNNGSVGIAILGCFEETDGACYTRYPVTDATKEAVKQLIGVKSAQFGIDPEEDITFQERDIQRVIGHRDVDYTYCPGSDMEADIPEIRATAHDIYREQLARLYEGNFVSEDSFSISRNDPEEITIQYTNTGLDTWERDALYLKIYRKSGKKPTNLRDESWPDVLGKIRMQEKSVEPGETATFSFSINVPDGATERTIMTKLFLEKTKVKKTNAQIHFTFSDRQTTNTDT